MEQQLTITKRNARAAYNAAGSEGKQMLVNLFGGLVFSEKVTERVKTMQDVFEEAGVNAADYTVKDMDSNEHKAAIYRKRLKLVEKVFNPEGWKARMADTSQKKFRPWHQIIADSSHPSGFRLVCNDYGYGYVSADLGARPPYFHDSATAIYVGKQFAEEYEMHAYYEELADN